jgi:hypothetical protein
MPLETGFRVVSAAMNDDNTVITIVIEQGGENQYPSCGIRVTPDGVWLAPTITSWSDTLVTGEFSEALGDGIYDVEVTSADNIADTLLEAFTIGDESVPKCTVVRSSRGRMSRSRF